LQRFRSPIDATADAIFLIDQKRMTLVDVNQGACRMLGYQREVLLDFDPQVLGLAAPAHQGAQRP
jgi:PAS domain S-box-containing protein